MQKKTVRAWLLYLSVLVCLFSIKYIQHLYYAEIRNHQKYINTEDQLNEIEHFLIFYYSRNQFFPLKLEKLKELKRIKIYIDFIDAWGKEIKYFTDGKMFTLISYGADKKKGGNNYNKDIIYKFSSSKTGK